MGKVVKAAVGIAATVAIAVAAPYLTPAFLSAALGATAATAIATAALSLAAGMLMKELAPSPRTASNAPALGWAPTSGLIVPFGAKHAEPTIEEISAKARSRWLDPLFWPWERIVVGGESIGNCMDGIEKGPWPVIDRDASLRRGDFIVFGIDDYRSYTGPAGKVTKHGGLAKRFVGIDPDRGVMIVECTTPYTRIETGLSRITFAHRVRATGNTEAEARCIAAAIRKDDRLYQDRLALVERETA